MATVYNHDLVGLISRLDRFSFELAKSVSSNTSELNEFDRQRLMKSLEAYGAYLNFVVDQPQLDLPESHPHEVTIPEKVAIAPVESEIVNDVLRIMDILRIEMLDSQSARKAAGIISFDEARFRSLQSKLNKYVTDYVDNYTPLDLPESSPQTVMSTAGRKGV